MIRICIRMADGNTAYNLKNTPNLTIEQFRDYLKWHEWLKVSETEILNPRFIQSVQFYDDADSVDCFEWTQ